jgi:hypothetical protein
MVQINIAYHLTFESRFAAMTGIYVITNIVNYGFILDNKIDLFETLYKSVGLTQADLKTDLSSYRNVSFWVMENVNTKKIFYVPDILVINEPDPYVKKYPLMALSLNIGPIGDTTVIDTYKEVISDQIKARVGIDAEAKTMVYGYRYMRVSDYETLEATRETLKSSVINLTSELQRKEAEIIRLEGLVTHLEELTTQLLPD